MKGSRAIKNGIGTNSNDTKTAECKQQKVSLSWLYFNPKDTCHTKQPCGER